jgi:hypothetical protein
MKFENAMLFYKGNTKGNYQAFYFESRPDKPVLR